ncbi:MAG: exonuclease domain-containing protein [Leptolyngbyaceae cyanobacterium]
MTLNLLIIDTETTGIDSTVDSVIEIGAILYSVNCKTTLSQLSFLLHATDNAAEHINRIPPVALTHIPNALQERSLDLLGNMAANASYVVAHNAAFDAQWFDDKHLPIIRGNNHQPLKWLCSMADMTWPKQTRPGESLINLALYHGIGVSSAHRALTDCQLLAELFSRLSSNELADLIAQSLRPKAVFKAEVSYDDRHLAKEAGFRWNPDSKTWTRKMAIEDAAQLPFQTTSIQLLH